VTGERLISFDGVRTVSICLAAAFISSVCCAQEPVFRADSTLVHVDAEVRQRDRNIGGLHKQDFLINDNGRPQPILYFSQDVEPLDIILLFDVSGSMRSNVEKLSVASWQALAELHPGDSAAVMTFNRRSRMVTPLTDDLTAVSDTIRNQVVGGDFGGGTQILAAIDDAARYFQSRQPAHRRRAVLIFTDNYGTRSRRVSTVVRRLWEADAVLSGLIVRSASATALNTAIMVTSPLAMMMREGIGPVADQTGGDIIKGDDPAEAFRQAVMRLRLRYSLYYAAPPGPSGEKRKIKVELSEDALSRYPSARVYARKGYVRP